MLAGTRQVAFGTRLGGHGPLDCFVYERLGTSLEMLFAFYPNFTDNDLICKVVARGEAPDTKGASIQFNGGRSVVPHPSDDLELRHAGSVTVGSAIKRAKLAELINRHASSVLSRFGDFDAATSWPFRIGTVGDFDALLDRLFDYAFAIEQAKRIVRGEALLVLSSNPAHDVTGVAWPIGGQGFLADAPLRSAIEDRAMELATEYFVELGYEVDDMHTGNPFDLRVRRGTDELTVEVKGTQTSGGAVILTANEVSHARANAPHVVLVVARDICVADDMDRSARGGELDVYWPWVPDEHQLRAAHYIAELDPARRRGSAARGRRSGSR